MVPVGLRGSTYEVVWPNQWSCVTQPMKLCDPTCEVVWPNLWSRVTQPVKLCDPTYEVVWPNLLSCVTQPMKLCDPTYEVVWPNLWSCVTQPMKLGLNENKSNRLTKLNQFALVNFFTDKTLLFLVWRVMVVLVWRVMVVFYLYQNAIKYILVCLISDFLLTSNAKMHFCLFVCRSNVVIYIQ